MSPRDLWPPPEVTESDWAMNPVSFARDALGFTPDAHQARILTSLIAGVCSIAPASGASPLSSRSKPFTAASSGPNP